MPGDDERDLVSEIEALEREGPRGRHQLCRLMLRGDWRARTLAASALGRIVRMDTTAWRKTSFLGQVLGRVPGIRRRLPTVGHRGRLVSRAIANGLADRCLVVRTAAALALGECRDASLAPALRALLRDPFRPPRLAAAAALAACGAEDGRPALDDCAATPSQLGDGAATPDWLASLAERHLALLTSLAARLGEPDIGDAVPAGAWLAGTTVAAASGGPLAEVERYANEADLTWQRSKPFAAEDRAEGLRLLDTFVAAAAQLECPKGSRVLDLGGGPGWVSELLARLGLRPVTIDLSSSLLRLGRERFREAKLPARLVRGDMTALPFADGTFEAAVVVDALHHVPEMEGALREARRVLTRGGRLVLAEPGEGHSETAKSRAEAGEHGVREGEVHPFAIERLARAAGFERVRIVPRLPLGPTFTAAQLRRAMRQPVERWQVEGQSAREGFDGLLLQAMLDHPILVLEAGERRVDSRTPALLRAEIRPQLTRQGGSIRGFVEVRNSGDTLWLAAPAGGDGQVRLGLQLLTVDGRLVARDFARVALDDDVPPGGAARLHVTLELPAASETVGLKLDLVVERLCWFEDRGSSAVRLTI